MKDFWAEELQKQQRSKLKKFAVFIIIIAIIIAILILIIMYMCNMKFRMWCDDNIINKEILQEDTKSIELDGDENAQIYAYDKYICIFRKKNLEYYNEIGLKVATIELDINKAVFTSSGRYMVISEENGKTFYLICGKEVLFKNQEEANINQIHVSRNGYISIVMSNASYKSIVDVYDKSGKEIFKTNLVSSRVVDVSISQDSKYLAIAEIDLSGILIQSSIQIVSIELAQKNPQEAILGKYQVEADKLITNIEYQEKDKLICMYNDSIEIFENENSTELVNLMDKKLSFMTINLNNNVAILEEISTGQYTSDTYVNLINLKTLKRRQYIANDVAKSLKTSENRMAINFGTELHIISKSGILIKKYISQTEINDIVMTDSLVGVIYRDKIQIINL